MLGGPPISWDSLTGCIYLGDGHAVVHATGPPPIVKAKVRRVLGLSAEAAMGGPGMRVPMQIKAMNGMARRLCAASPNPEVQRAPTTDADGEEFATHAKDAAGHAGSASSHLQSARQS